jgi:hypothetical protein
MKSKGGGHSGSHPDFSNSDRVVKRLILPSQYPTPPIGTLVTYRVVDFFLDAVLNSDERLKGCLLPVSGSL